jgi:hypothetical protein
VVAAVDEILGRPQRPQPVCRHTPPLDFVRGTGLSLAVTCPAPASPSSVVLRYRRVNQAERYQATDMHRRGDAWHATVPASYTDSAFPLQYYFEFREGTDRAWMHPGFASDLASTPYFLVRRARSAE